MILLILTNMNKLRYCVYSHSFNGHIFYIGCGNENRPENFLSRNNLWKEYVKRSVDFNVTIHEWFDNKESALAYEKELIHKFNPCCNVNNSDYHSQPGGNEINDEIWNIKNDKHNLSKLSKKVNNDSKLSSNEVVDLKKSIDTYLKEIMESNKSYVNDQLCKIDHNIKYLEYRKGKLYELLEKMNNYGKKT